MRNLIIGLLVFSFLCVSPCFSKDIPIIRVFYSPLCQPCEKVLKEVLPPLTEKYGDKVEWFYLDITDEQNFMAFKNLQELFGRKSATPMIVVNNRVLIGVLEISSLLEVNIKEVLK